MVAHAAYPTSLSCQVTSYLHRAGPSSDLQPADPWTLPAMRQQCALIHKKGTCKTLMSTKQPLKVCRHGTAQV